MQQVYSEQHLTQAHHHGLVAGTLIGSIFVSGFVAVMAIVASPSRILHPFSNLTSNVSAQPTTTQTTELGSGATGATTISKPTTVNGSAVSAASQFSADR